MDYRIYPPEEILDVRLSLPPSKSYMARKMVIDAIAGCPSGGDVCACDDITVLARALELYRSGGAVSAAAVDLGGSGTALRFLTALFAATEGCDVVLDGNESLRRRPMAILVDALRQLGAEIEYLQQEGFAPLAVRGRRLAGGSLPIDPTVSSQFVSALMLVSPLLDAPLRIRIEGEAASMPYIRMTAGMMRRRGAVADIERYDIDLAPGSYSADDDYMPELDWTAASYWYETAALTAGWVTLPGFNATDLQGDRLLAEIMPRLGVLSEFGTDDEGEEALCLSATPDLWGRLELDLSQNPDLTPALAVTAAALSVPFRLSGLENLRVKECDRLEALRQELLKIGIVAEIDGPGVLLWEGQRAPVVEIPEIDTHGDHRMAMAFAPLAVFAPGIVIRDAEVADKSYPGFWDDLRQAGFTLESTAAD
ncbi:MAG: 3-phosphoshikimate 1-carboxyvinyltransferase [Muribaculaceae bacterium]|nr:3-phosphoshikimate 1-carboxyvinyltransferase [Muribaculaceae bacterium]